MGLKSLLLTLGITIPAGIGGIYCISKIEGPALRLGLGTVGATAMGYGIGIAISREIKELREMERREYKLRLRRKYDGPL